MPDILGGVVAIGFLALWIYCIYDVITTGNAIIRHLPKVLWLIIVVLLSDLGSLLWLGLGRPRAWTRLAQNAQRHGTGPPMRDGSHVHDDLHPHREQNPIVRYREEQARLRLREEQQNRREAELRRREIGEGPAT